MAARALIAGSAVIVPIPDPLRRPTDAHPRWRLVVFDKRWPWRTTRGQVLRDALASRHGSFDRDDKVVYLGPCVFIQRDPPERPWGGVR